MIKKIILKNFKLHKCTDIDAKPLTIFIGPNNSGKSSIFHSLMALKQAAITGGQKFISLHADKNSPISVNLPSPNYIIDIGEFKDVVRRGEDTIAIQLEGDIKSNVKGLDFIQVNFEISYKENNFINYKCSIKSPHHQFKCELGPNYKEILPPSLQIEGIHIGIEPRLFKLERIAFSYVTGTSGTIVQEVHHMTTTLFNSPSSLLQSIHPIYPLRGFEEWAYPLPDYAASLMEMPTLSDRAVALMSILAYNKTMEKQLSNWLNEMFGLELEVELFPQKRIILRVKKQNTLFSNEGTGTSQIPFMLLPIGLMAANETILLPEPEAHLHPKAQSQLVSLLLKINKMENKQIMIETHSEHILHGFLYALAKNEIRPDQIALYYFENINGEASVRHLAIDSKGRIKGGLPGFFEHSINELSEYLDALK